MKIFKYITLLFASLVLIVSCTDEVETPTLSEGVAPVLENPDGSLEYVFTEENKGNPFETFVYSAANYGLPVITNYTIEIATSGDAAFESPVSVQEASTQLFQTSDIETFNLALGNTGLNLTPEEQSTIQVRIKAQPSNQSVEVLYSNVMELKITPYDAVVPPIYVVGNATEADWSPGDAIPLPSVSASGYEGIVAITATTVENPVSFRFLANNLGWNPGYFYGDFDIVESSPAGLVSGAPPNEYDEINFQVSETGNYLIEVDFDNNGKKTVLFTKQ